MNEYLEAGLIANTHGIAGDVVMDSYCDSPRVLAKLKVLYLKSGNEYRELKIKKAAEYKGRVLAHIEGYESIEQASALKGRTVYASRDQFKLGKGAYFIADIIGLPAYDINSGEKVGTLTDVLMYGMGDIYEITCEDGHKALVPAVPEFVKNVDTEKGVYFAFIEGMI
ncbi:MAG: 16S rRNA processing protein RimM [Clostridia bacterium]|nr:16S rRNA processing protein RimM [Clostridia bacterium]